jgi:hypothetical protein
MTRAIFLALLCALPLAADPRPSRVGLYDFYATRPEILRGITMTESDATPRAIGDDGISEGANQLNRKFHGERAWWWGSYDPFAINDSIRITSCLFRANLRALLMAERMIDPSTWERKREDIAIAAHRQGLRGALRNGPAAWYIDRVRRLGK